MFIALVRTVAHIYLFINYLLHLLVGSGSVKQRSSIFFLQWPTSCLSLNLGTFSPFFYRTQDAVHWLTHTLVSQPTHTKEDVYTHSLTISQENHTRIIKRSSQVIIITSIVLLNIFLLRVIILFSRCVYAMSRTSEVLNIDR